MKKKSVPPQATKQPPPAPGKPINVYNVDPIAWAKFVQYAKRVRKGTVGQYLDEAVRLIGERDGWLD